MHGLLSVQFLAFPDLQVPPEHVSLIVHLLPSSHSPAAGECWQPLLAEHLSTVHTLESLQTTGLPTQLPPLQASFEVHFLLSSQPPAT